MSDDGLISWDGSRDPQLLALVTAVAPKTKVRVSYEFTAETLRQLILNGWRGPDHMSTAQCEMIIGGSQSMWRAAAAAGLIPGAEKKKSAGKKGGDWSLPNAAAREYYATHVINRNATAAGPAGGTPATGSGSRAPRPSSLPAHARGRRGPRKVALAVVKGGQP